MKIRLKLTLQFVLITALINCLAFFIIYGLSANYRQEQYYDRLYDKAINTAKLLVDVQEIDENLLRIIEENTVSLFDEKLLIYDFNDEIIYSNLDLPVEGYPIELVNQIRLEKNIRFEEGNKAIVGVLYSGEFDRFVVIVSAFDKFGLSKLNNLKWILIFVFVGILLLTFLGGWLFATQALRPITGVIEEVKQISDRNLNARVNEGNGTDEIAELAKTFNLMLTRLEKAFFSQKSFVSHASHELRTPLTAITGQIEVTLLNARTNEEYRETLKSVLDDIKGLSNLTNGLLDLVQTDPTHIISRFEKVRIDDALFYSIDQVKKKYQGVPVTIDFDGFPEVEQDLLIMGNDYLLKSAITNILDNACKFSNNDEVKVSFENCSDRLLIKIKDKGIGIEGKDLDEIFNPFFRADNAARFKGYGLGLPLAKQIFKMHGIKLKVESTPGSGTVFSVVFNKN